MASLKLLLYSLLCHPRARSRTNLKKTQTPTMFSFTIHTKLWISRSRRFVALFCQCSAERPKQWRDEKESRNVLSCWENDGDHHEWMALFFHHFITSLKSDSVIAVHRIEAERTMRRWRKSSRLWNKDKAQQWNTLFEAIKKIESC